MLLTALSLFVGLNLGLLGGGGAILAVPLFTAVGGMTAHEAVGASLLVVGLGSLVSLIPPRRHRAVNWKVAAVMAAVGAPAGIAGQAVASITPEPVIMLTFAAIMLAASFKMLTGRKGARDAGTTAASTTAAAANQASPSLRLALLMGAGVGFLTGFVGAGGGFIIVPTLVLIAGLAMPAAVATSLVVIAANSLVSFASYIRTGELDWHVVGPALAAVLIGAVIGTALASKVRADVLRTLFGLLVLTIAVAVIGSEMWALV